MDGYLLSWRQDTDTLGWDLIRDIQWPCLVSWWHWTQWSASCGWSVWGVMPGETSSHLICDCIMIFKSSWEMIWSVSLSVRYFPLGFLVSKSEQVLEGGAWWPQLEVTQSDSGAGQRHTLLLCMYNVHLSPPSHFPPSRLFNDCWTTEGWPIALLSSHKLTFKAEIYWNERPTADICCGESPVLCLTTDCLTQYEWGSQGEHTWDAAAALCTLIVSRVSSH